MVLSTDATVLYLERLEKYETEKPYEVMFDLAEFGDNARQTNCCLQPTPVSFLNARKSAKPFTLNSNGFQLLHAPSTLQGDDFENEDLVRKIYLPHVMECVARVLDEPAEMHILNHKIRKRNSVFPSVVMEESKYLQPIPSAHCDFSPGGAPPALEGIISRNPHLKDRPFQIINVWRLMRGPTSDWPLAVCDYQTIDLEKDIEECDRVASDRLTESVLLYPNPNHRWYFYYSQTVDEVLIFRNCDSRGYTVPFGVHVSFDFQSDVLPKLARESVEARVACFF
ncbi:hypothetical protein L207DRAFT_272083 [Hyaloscypha variabilis F]|uniref:CmcJ-like methyltransferase n=1 Tax=Hyaloscypha variabilis (strain UAMH 11265 / GT02V1 / F) TaxID=1149755 RepID=A0A2J6S022_HYAVF|nr:hypothetical protein L207DRAFT_272083 [Hyaloscypha variabilis F]